jgi:cell division protein FtsN
MFVFGKEKNIIVDTAPAEKKSFIELSRKKALLWLLGLLFVCIWMFVLGILVGRDLMPVRFDVGSKRDVKEEFRIGVEKEKEEKKNSGSHATGQTYLDGKQDLKFYDDLKSMKNSAEEMKMDSGALNDVPLKKPEPFKTEDKTVAETDGTKETAANEKAFQDKISGPVFTVQTSSGKDKKGAERRVKALINKGYPAYLAASEIPGKGTWYRVRVGEYRDKNEAEKVLSKLGQDKIKGIIVTSGNQ